MLQEGFCSSVAKYMYCKSQSFSATVSNSHGDSGSNELQWPGVSSRFWAARQLPFTGGQNMFGFNFLITKEYFDVPMAGRQNYVYSQPVCLLSSP